MTHSYRYTRERRPTLHPSGMVVYLPTGRTLAVCVCGNRFTIPSQDEPQRTVPGRKGVLTVQRACT